MNETNHPSPLVTCTLIQDLLGITDGGIYEAVASLKQRLDAVVAECARVQAFATETARDAEEMATADGGGGGYIEALNELLTPTASALAEQQAIGVEKAIEHLHCAISPTPDAITIVGVLNDFAAALRKGESQ